jgi:hypothetical protein
LFVLKSKKAEVAIRKGCDAVSLRENFRRFGGKNLYPIVKGCGEYFLDGDTKKTTKNTRKHKNTE